MTCTAPPDSVHATHVSTVPKQRSRAAAAIGQLFEQPLQLRRRLVGAAAARPATRSVRHAPTVRRSCQPMPGTDRFARRAVPHDGRTALVRDADRVDRARAARARRVASSRHVSAIARASNWTRPSAGESGSSSRSTKCDTAPFGVDTPTRTLLVPTSTTSTSVGAHGQASSPNGLRRPSLPGFRMPFGSSASFTDCSTPKPVAERVGDEARPVEADAVVMRERAARGEHRALTRVPHRAVVRLALVRRAAGPRT